MTEPMTDPVDGPTTTAAPVTPPSAPFRLMRLREGKILGGVAGGLGRAAGIDPSLARLAVFAACLTGVGLCAYVVLWLVLPQEAPWRNEFARTAPEPTGMYVRVGLAIAAGLGVLQTVGNIGGAFAWSQANWGYGPRGGGIDIGGGVGLVLIGFGAAVLLARRREPAAAGPGSSTPGETDRAAGVQYSGDPGGGEPRVTGDAPATPRSLIAARVLGWLALVWVVLGAAMGAFLWWAGALDPGAPGIAVPLAVIAFAVAVVTLIRSRRPVVIFLAVASLLLPAAIAAQGDIDGDMGVRQLQLNDQTLARSYRMAAGQLVLDLRDMEVLEGRRTVDVEMGAGQIIVRLPASVSSEVTARTRLGGIAAFGQVRGGSHEFVRVITPGCPERGDLVLRLRAHVGHIEVEGPGGSFPLAACRRGET